MYISDVPLWLKSLRLHKYANLFQQLNYDEMLNMNEDWLQQQVILFVLMLYIPVNNISVMLG